MIRWAALLLGFFLVPFGRDEPARADELVVDLSKSLVEISTQFVGSELLLFGSIEDPGDIIVAVRGPARREVVRRKDQIFGVWVNNAYMVFGNVPSFYALAASRPIDELLPQTLQAVHEIGEANLILVPHSGDAKPEEISGFRAALIREKERQRLFSSSVGTVRFLANQLFRTEVAIPATVSTGVYEIDIYLVRDRRVVREQSVTLTVRKSGLEAQVSEFARRQSLAYGLLAVLIAVMAGWLAGMAFRRR